MSKPFFQKTITYLIAGVWLVNGLYCKVLNQVPRHQEIVGAILGTEYAPLLSQLIGFSEIIMAIWILSGFEKRVNSILQIAVVLTMNFLEFFLVRDLLMWGGLNFLFALLFCGLVYWNNFK